MIKKLYILNIIESLALGGGAEQALVNLLPELQKRGHKCEVAVLWPPYDLSDKLESLGIKVHKLNIKSRWNIADGIIKIRKLQKNAHYDLIHSHLFYAELFLALSRPLISKTKLITTFHNLDYDSYPTNTLFKKIIKVMDAFIVRHFIDGKIAVSEAAARHYAKHLSLSNIKVIPNAISLVYAESIVKINRKNIISTIKIDCNDFVIVIAARLVHEKGHRFLLQAIKLLEKDNLYPKVLIIGDGPLRQNILNDISDNNLTKQVSVCGKMDQATLFTVIKACDVFALPSTHEGFGLALAEAMALGTPVIGSCVGGIPDLVEDEVSGLMIKPSDPIELANAIRKFVLDKKLSLKLGMQARKKISENFSLEVVCDKWEKYFEECFDLQ